MDESAQTKTTQESNGSTGGKWNPIELVMIHGVGDPKPGDLLQEYCEGKCAAGQPSQARVERLQLGDTEYAVLIPDVLFLGKQKVSEMVEVNWADVQRPSQGKLGVFGHALMLCFALRNLSLDPDRNPSQIARWATLAYWLLVEGAAIWIALGVIAFMLLISLNSTPLDTFRFAVAESAAIASLAWFFARNKRPRYWVGLAWALAYLMVGIKASYANSQTREALVEISTNLYQYSQTISIIWFLAAMTLALLLGGGTLSRRAARAGFIWLPFVIITSILVGLWLGALLLTKVPGWFQGYHNWEWTFAHTLKYNLKFAEEAMMLAQVAIFVGVPVVGVIAYFSERIPGSVRFLVPALLAIFLLTCVPKIPAAIVTLVVLIVFALLTRIIWPVGKTAGASAHNTVELFLLAGVVSFWAAILAISVFGRDGDLGKENQDIISTYAISALRLPALLAFLLPGLRTISDIVGDVIFHFQPKWSEVGSADTTVPRLKKLIEFLCAKRRDHDLVIIAHSEGTVIVWSLLSDDNTFSGRLITAGSPLTTLHTRYLGDAFAKRITDTFRWDNFYRTGDYVGGAVDATVNNKCVGDGPHTDYWSDPAVIRAIDERFR